MSDQKQGLQRSLNLLDATMLVAGSMIGSGIFIVSVDMSRQLGSSGWLLTLWLLSGFITLMAALCYGELSSMMPEAGGQFVYIQKAWGNFTSFLYGWTVFSVIQTGVIAAVAVAFAKYAAFYFSSLSADNIIFSVLNLNVNAQQICAIAIIFFLTLINVFGVDNGKWVQTIFTAAKILAILFLIFAGLYVSLKLPYFKENFANMWQAQSLVFSKESNTWLSGNLSGMALIMALGTAAIGSLFSSDAWNNVTFIAGEIKNPGKNIPLSLLFGTGIVTLLYILANVTYLGLLPLHGQPGTGTVFSQGIQFAGDGSDRVGTAAASVIFGDTAAYIMALLIMISTFGCNNGIILSGARVYFAMAKEGLFLPAASRLNSKGVPAFSLWLQAFWASVLCLSGSYGDLLDYTTFASLIFYMVTIGGIFVLRKKLPDANRPYKVPLYPLLPIMYILLAGIICLILMFTKPENTQSGIIIVLIGVPVYFLVKRKKNKKNETVN